MHTRVTFVPMASVVNLNKFRKAKAKVEREKRADTNRRLHGRTKAERTNDELRKRLLDAKVQGAHLERNQTSSGEEEE